MIKHLPKVYFNEELFEDNIALTTQRNGAQSDRKKVGVNTLIQSTS